MPPTLRVMVRKPLVVPEPPAVPQPSAALRKLVDKALGPHRMVADMSRDAKALGAVLVRDPKLAKAMEASIVALAHGLAALGPLENIASKSLRRTAHERKHQLEMAMWALRLTSAAHDTTFARLAVDVGDNEIRGLIAECLRGEKMKAPPRATKAVAALLDVSTNVFALRAAFDALYELGVKKAHARWAKILRAGKPTLLVEIVLDQIDERERDQTPWAPLAFPLTVGRDFAIARAARRLIQHDASSFLAYLDWLTRTRERDTLKTGLTAVTQGLYWATLSDGTLKGRVGPPLLALRARGSDRGMKTEVAELDRALAKLGFAAARRPIGLTLGAKIKTVGTGGGAPLLVPAEIAPAWLGAFGPQPFDSGKSDYERAAKLASLPALLTIGKGKGLVLDGTQCTVHAERDGFLLHASGDPEEANPKRWKKLGVLAVGKSGLLLLDSALAGAGKTKRAEREPIATPAGRYTILAHRPGGFGTDFAAVRLVRPKAE